MSTTSLTGPRNDLAPHAERILRSLPLWFGVEASLCEYVRDAVLLPTFTCDVAGTPAAFLTLREHFPRAWEIHCMAVHADHRGQGLGGRLLAHVETWLRARGVRWLQVKTIDGSHPSAEYGQTRAFYVAKGFEPLETFPVLWGAQAPALQLLKTLGTA